MSAGKQGGALDGYEAKSEKTFSETSKLCLTMSMCSIVIMCSYGSQDDAMCVRGLVPAFREVRWAFRPGGSGSLVSGECTRNHDLRIPDGEISGVAQYLEECRSSLDRRMPRLCPGVSNDWCISFF